jgi:hypothetical protein
MCILKILGSLRRPPTVERADFASRLTLVAAQVHPTNRRYVGQFTDSDAPVEYHRGLPSSLLLDDFIFQDTVNARRAFLTEDEGFSHVMLASSALKKLSFKVNLSSEQVGGCW